MVSRINPTNKLSPDGSGRFFMMSKILEVLFGKSAKNISILDVGGGSPYMVSQINNILSKTKISTLDITPEPIGFNGTYIQGDATNMPFDSRIFDAVISTDVLEHISPSKKVNFVKECIRVARDFVVIAAPFNTEGVEEAERATNDLNIKLFKHGQDWLEEHFENKKPELSMILDIAKDMNYRTVVIGTNNIYTWLLSTHVNLIEAKLGLSVQKHHKSNSDINEHLLSSGDILAPHYRHFVIILKKPILKKTENRLLQLAKPKINHIPSINYFHEMMSLLSEEMVVRTAELKDSYQKTKKMKTTNEQLEKQIEEQKLIINRCRPYLKILELNPKRILHRKTD